MNLAKILPAFVVAVPTLALAHPGHDYASDGLVHAVTSAFHLGPLLSMTLWTIALIAAAAGVLLPRASRTSAARIAGVALLGGACGLAALLLQ